MKAMPNEFEKKLAEEAREGIYSHGIRIIQVNVGLRCNQQCVHCHVSASPNRREVMEWDTMERIIEAARMVRCELVDITGGAPELNPHFHRFVQALRTEGFPVQVRTNLTVLLEPGMEWTAHFYRENSVRLVASLPCYLEENVRAQRGEGVYEKSIEAIRLLNDLGYGVDPKLQLNLVYNPVGPVLPPDQESLEADYRRELGSRFGVEFTRLLTITNMPIGRFLTELKRQKKEREYMDALVRAFNALTVDGLMCTYQLCVDWEGKLYDCDFNLALGMCVNHGAPMHIKDFDLDALAERRIVTGNHCFGCTAGHGSSCSGAVVED
jgi:radical SAM/Cys-rich protein